MKCPFSCPKMKKAFMFLGIIGLITSLFVWFGASKMATWEFVAHKERLAIFGAILSNILLSLGKPSCCPCCTDGKCGEKSSCDVK